MDLVAVVVEITGRPVTIQEARNFAFSQFNLLEAYFKLKYEKSVFVVDNPDEENYQELGEQMSLSQFQEAFNSGGEVMDKYIIIE